MSLFKIESARGIYRMGEVTDYSGNGNDLTVSGASVVAGKLGNAYSFDGTDDYAENASIISDLTSDTKGTIAGWFYLDSDTGGYETIISLSDGAAGGSELTIYADMAANNALEIFTNLGFDVYSETNSLSALVGTWVSFVVIHDGTQVSKIYINGVSQTINRSTTTDESIWFSKAITAGVDLLSMGTLYSGVRQLFFNGDIDEISLNGAEWDATDVEAFYNGGTGRVITDTRGSNLTTLKVQ